MPRRLLSESRPFLVETPAFFCAISESSRVSGSELRAGDVGDAHNRKVLPVALLAARIFAAALFECDQLGPAGVLYKLRDDLRARDDWRTELNIGARAHHQHLVKFNLGAGVAGYSFDGDDVVLRDAILRAACLDDSVHGLSFRPFKACFRALRRHRKTMDFQ